MTQRLNTFFSASPELCALAQKSRELAALQRHYRRLLPPTLASASQVIDFEQHIIIVGATNNAVAAKLRQLAPQLVQSFQGVEAKVTGIRVKVQVANPLPGRKLPENSLSVAGREHLAKLATALSESPLKKVLQRFSKIN